ncbi:TPA: hypothetical protein ACGWDB_001059 [Streptococcus agalactiae]|uniref:hypothetical protein n=1 Tax=Streptococcus agalactiae TaxID=1311 RepID=UPI001E419760|nr:hypothetical protein [Streptococcus agalactiae]MCL6304761.1 hypothetical protein [Streptococcus agalactiae]MCL6314342.1 hypothetical protein [Streptococcus agalactiae]
MLDKPSRNSPRDKLKNHLKACQTPLKNYPLKAVFLAVIFIAIVFSFFLFSNTNIPKGYGLHYLIVTDTVSLGLSMSSSKFIS